MLEAVPGDVLLIAGKYSTSENPKLHICLSYGHGIFFRLVHKPLFRPTFLIPAIECPFIESDIYAELSRIVQFSPIEIQAGVYKGRIPKLVRRDLADAILKAPTLTAEQKSQISQRLVSDYDAADDEIWSFGGSSHLPD